jgi:O-methyltransferase
MNRDGTPFRGRVDTAVAVALDRVGLQRIDRRPDDMDDEFVELQGRCAPHTMTTIERMYALWQAVRYIAARGVPGDFVECGVWRGGSSMLAALTFEAAGDRHREFHLYDTFEGMAEPSWEDGALARRMWSRHQQANHNDWCYSPIDEVRENMLSTGLLEERLHLVKGKVEETIPDRAPERIALLRLDTDFYSSTRHELVHLFPLLQPGGVLVIDDYGDWGGARRAVDEYIAEHAIAVLLTRVDSTGRVAIKP